MRLQEKKGQRTHPLTCGLVGRHALELGEHAIYPTPWGFAIAA